MNIKALHSSKSNEWETPQWLFDKLNEEFNFTLDPCTTKEMAKCKKYYTQVEDGLIQDWSKDIVFMNPPYGKDISKWITKALSSSIKGATVVCLIPARTDTNWFQYCWKADYLYSIKGRVKFLQEGKSVGSATFPSVIVVWNHKDNFKLNFDGHLVKLWE